MNPMRKLTKTQLQRLTIYRVVSHHNVPNFQAEVAELADALDSKSSDSNIVWVRVPPSASLSHQQFATP